MTERDAFIVKQLNDNAALYRGIFIVLGIAGIAGIVMGVVVLTMGKPGGLISLVGMAVGLIASALSARSRSNAFADAVREIGDEPDNLDAYHDYSKQTINLIAEVKLPPKAFLQMVIAYGASALMCLAGGIALIVLIDEGGMFLVLAGILFAFAVLLGLLTFNSYNNWKTAKRLESFS